MRRFLISMTIVATLAFASVAHAATIFEINGGGYGHGVGMSQYGAYGYALHGEDYQFILGHYFQGTSLGTVSPNQTVRVLIATGAASFTGASRASAPAAPTRKLNPSKTYAVRVLADGTLELYSPRGKKLGNYSALLSVSGPGPLELAGHGAYRGAFEFRPAAGGVQTVNAVGLDDYVQGVVPAEMPSSWAPAALEAQAVAARTYAITTSVSGNGFQLYPDTRSQMYGGVGAETAATNAAVAATAGQVVTYAGAPVVTYFFSSSGGYTENVENVFVGAAPEPWLRGVPDPYDGVAGNPRYRWSYRMTLASAASTLASLVQGKLRGIRVTQRGVSPRVVAALVVGTRGKTPVTGPQLEQLFGLPSTYMRFTIITSVPVPKPAVPVAAVDHLRLRSATVEAQLRSATRRLTGAVSPAARGSVVTVQRDTAKGWRTLRRVRVDAEGSYGLAIAARGTYRIVYAGVTGPAVTLR
jgi:stage II sporulation protein D